MNQTDRVVRRAPASEPRRRAALELGLGLACALGMLAAPAALAQNARSATAAPAYPLRAITIVVPGPAGGSGDIMARLVGKEMSEALGQPVIIDNRPGGGGIIGAQAMLRAAPDGYTLMMGNTGPNATNYSLYKQQAYKPQDFAGIGDVILFPNVLAVRADSPFRSAADLIAAARAAPGKYTYASSGLGQTTHLSAELLALASGAQFVHVPYKGANLGIQAVIAGEVDFMFDNFPSIQGQLHGGRVRALAVTSAARTPQLPDTPTMAEAGVKNLVVTGWFGLVARADIPPAIRDQLAQTLQAVLRRDTVRARFHQLGGTPGTMTPPEFDAFMKAEIGRWGAAIKAANVTLE